MAYGQGTGGLCGVDQFVIERGLAVEESVAVCEVASALAFYAHEAAWGSAGRLVRENPVHAGGGSELGAFGYQSAASVSKVGLGVM